MKAFKTILIGVGATFTIDCFTFIISLFGNSPRGILFVGRWLAYMPQGTFLHHTIIETPAIANELIIGQIAHYCIGITFAFLLVKIFGEKWLYKPTLYPALIIAIVTLIIPVFILQPALGFGIAFSNMPQQIQLLTKTVIIHAIYGIGLYFSAVMLNGITLEVKILKAFKEFILETSKTMHRRKFIKQSGLAMVALALPFLFTKKIKENKMKENNKYDVIIVGGSYSGLAAAMALGRALKKVLIIDGGKPCNAQTPHSHNFLTQDGKTPKEIATLARQQVEKYDTITFFEGFATNGRKIANQFEIEITSGETFQADKLIFATGIKDEMPNIEGFSDCWGISMLHCPYCHGYEVRNEKTGILANGEHGNELVKLISNWTNDLTLFTNGISTLSVEQVRKFQERNIKIVEKEIKELDHKNGYLKNIIFKNGTKTKMEAMYSRNAFEQHCTIPQSLGCVLNEEGYIKVNHFQETSIDGIYACGDNVTRLRSVANSVAMGTAAGMMASKKMILEQF